MATRWQENYQLYKRYLRNLAATYQKRQDIRSFIELLLSISTIIIFGVFAIKPTLVTIGELNNQIAGKKTTIGLLDAKINALSEAEVVYTQNREAILLLNDAIPSNPVVETYVRQVEGLAGKNGVTILGLSTQNVPLVAGAATPEEVPAPSASDQPVDLFPQNAQSFELELNLSGTFSSLNNFLKDFELLRRPMFIDTLDIRLSQEAGASNLVLSIVGRLSYLPNE